MVQAAPASVPYLDWAVASCTLAGETACGDASFVKVFGECVLLGVLDGVGHGEPAAEAAAAAVAVLEIYGHEPLIPLFQRCHQQMRKTRGAVMSLASVDVRYNVVTWLGVGNAEGILLRADAQPDAGASRDTPLRGTPRHEFMMLFGGVVGYQLPALRAVSVPIACGDTLVLVTDGIRRNFLDDLALRETPQRMAGRISGQYGKDSDDSLVLVARYRGAQS